MKVHVLQHAPFEGLAGLSSLLAEHQACITSTRFFETPILPSLEGIDLIIAMGGPMSVNDEAGLPWLVEEKRFVHDAVKHGTPVLGVCLGAQLIASALGARVYRNPQKEIGWFPIEAVQAAGTDHAFAFPKKLNVFHWHGETFDLPAGAIHLARSAACEHQAFQVGRRTLALQFHLEVTLDAVKAFVENGEDELLPAPFIQTKAELLTAPASTYTEATACLRRVLEHLLG